MNEPVISINNFTMQIGDFALKNISLDLHKQEIFAILGKTGSGKTLLLESIAGYYKIEAGRILLRGVPVTQIPITKRNLGFVYQDYSLFPHMTVAQNIAYGLKMRRLPKAEITQKVRAIASIMGIEHILEQYPPILSGGEKQRTALARTLVLDPDVLLLDEPFSAMDPATKQVMYEQVYKIHQNFSCAILFVTHDFAEAQRLADRIGIMCKGELKAIRRRDNLFEYSGDQELDHFLGICQPPQSA